MELTEEEETERGSSVACSFKEDLRQRLTGGASQNCLEITEGEHDDDQEDEAQGTAIWVSNKTTEWTIRARGSHLSMTP